MVNGIDGCLQRHLLKMVVSMSRRSAHFNRANPLLGLVIMAALILPSVVAQSEETMQTSCKNGDLVRRVVIAESSLSSGQACEVIYWKDIEAPGERQVLWTAKQDAGYCYSKALVLVNQLAGMGWTCDTVSSPIDLPVDRSSLDAKRNPSS